MKDTYYFSHDQNARNDPKIMAMTDTYKAQGYGWWWIIVEMLAEEDSHRLQFTKWLYSALAKAMMCDKETAEKFITDCIEEFELFETDGKYFWSNSLNKRLDIREEKRKTLSDAGKKGANNRWHRDDSMAENSHPIATPLPPCSHPIAKHSKEKEIKLNKIKENNIKNKINKNTLINNLDNIISPGEKENTGECVFDNPDIRKINDAGCYELGMGQVTYEFLTDCTVWLKDGMEADLIIRALTKAKDKADNKSPPGLCNYAKTIIHAWVRDGTKTLEQYRIKCQPKQQKPNNAGNFSQRKYDEEYLNKFYENGVF